MVQRSKRVRYRHKRKGSSNGWFARLRARLWAAFKERFKKNPLRVSIIVLAIILIITLLIAHAFSREEYVSRDGYEHASVFSTFAIADGIDVSYAQGDIDWKKIKKAGIDFVFIRAGYRDTGKGNLHVDEYFEKNIEGASKAHIAVGVYYFSQATTSKEAEEEAKALLELIKPYEIDLPLVMDYEKHESGRLASVIAAGELTPEMLNKIALSFTATVEKAGYDSAVYANYDFLTHYLDGTALSKQTNIWTAQYNSFAQFSGSYQFWQCTDSLKLRGTESEYVDRDFWYIPTDSVWKSNAADASKRTSIGKCEIQLKKDTYKYRGFNIEPKLKLYDGRIRLRQGRDYELCYVDNNHKGTGYVVIRGVGDYKDSIAKAFTIE